MSTRVRYDELLGEVLDSVAVTPDPRLRELMETAIRHLHSFVTDVGLTRNEWKAGIDFLTCVGRACTDTRQEFILLSDTLGVSTVVEMGTAGTSDDATENTVLGPFYVPDSPLRAMGDSILEDEDVGPRATVSGRVTDLAGHPLAGAGIDIWQNASNQLYAVQDPGQRPTNLRGRFVTGDDGRFAFHTIRPVPYRIPFDGPVGAMLDATGRHPWRPAHIHFLVSAPGQKTLTTHVFDADSPYLDSDAVFGVRDSLVMRFAPSGDGAFTASFDIALDPADG